MGDFNKILYHWKKVGKASRLAHYVDAFQGVLNDI